MQIVTDSDDLQLGLSSACKPSTPSNVPEGGGCLRDSISLMIAPSSSWIALEVSSLMIFLNVC